MPLVLAAPAQRPRRHGDDGRRASASSATSCTTGPLGQRVEQGDRARPAAISADEAMADHCRRFVKTNYHPAGTARMGADGDRMAVLDARLRVRGIDNLRVCRHVGGAEHQRRQHQRAGDDARRPLRRLHPRPRIRPGRTKETMEKKELSSHDPRHDFGSTGRWRWSPGRRAASGSASPGRWRGRGACDHVFAGREARGGQGLKDAGHKIDYLQADVRDPAAIDRLIERGGRDHRAARYPRQQRGRGPAWGNP